MSMLLLGIAAAIAPPAEPSPYLIDEAVVPRIVCLDGKGGGSIGSGVRIAADMVVTAAHLIEGSKRCEVEGVAATVERIEPGQDIALLRVAKPAPLRAIAGCAPIEEGRVYLAVGYAEGFDMLRVQALTGTTARDRGQSEPRLRGMMVFRGTVTPGMSGGGIFDQLTGAAIGIINVYFDKGIMRALGRSFADTFVCKERRS